MPAKLRALLVTNFANISDTDTDDTATLMGSSTDP